MKKIFLYLIFFFIIQFSVFAYSNKSKISIITDEGKKIYAIDDAKLISYGYDIDDGNYIEIDYQNLGIIVKYCNLSKFKYFHNKNIKFADELGETGFTGAIAEPMINLRFSISISDFDEKLITINDGIVEEINLDSENHLFGIINYKNIGMKIQYCNLSEISLNKGESFHSGKVIGRNISITDDNVSVIEIDKDKFLFKSK